MCAGSYHMGDKQTRACQLFPRALALTVSWPAELWHEEDCLGTGGGWEVLMLVVGWCPNWATAATSCKSYCKGSSGWVTLSPDGKTRQLSLSGDRILSETASRSSVLSLPWKRLASVLYSLNNFPKAS